MQLAMNEAHWSPSALNGVESHVIQLHSKEQIHHARKENMKARDKLRCNQRDLKYKLFHCDIEECDLQPTEPETNENNMSLPLEEEVEQPVQLHTRHEINRARKASKKARDRERRLKRDLKYQQPCDE